MTISSVETTELHNALCVRPWQRYALNVTSTAARPSNPDPKTDGPDPAVGAGLVIGGVFIMGVGGASTAHYLFNAGTGVAILGALLFVAAVTISAFKQR
jgi:hypothetical protein